MIGLTQNPLKKGLTRDFGTQAIDKIWLLNAPLSKKMYHFDEIFSLRIFSLLNGLV